MSCIINDFSVFCRSIQCVCSCSAGREKLQQNAQIFACMKLQEGLWAECSQHHLCVCQTQIHSFSVFKPTAGGLLSSSERRGWMQIRCRAVLPWEAWSLVISQRSADSVGLLDSTGKRLFCSADMTSCVKDLNLLGKSLYFVPLLDN